MRFNPFLPGKPEDAAAFLKSVQPTAPSIVSIAGSTTKKIAQAGGHTVGLGLSTVLSPLKWGSYLLGNLAAIPSVIFNKIGGMTDKFQAKMMKAVGMDTGKSKSE